jgi:hypothetical protein
MKSSGEASDAHQTSILGNVGGERPAPDVGAHRGARCTQGRRGATEEEPIGGCVTPVAVTSGTRSVRQCDEMNASKARKWRRVYNTASLCSVRMSDDLTIRSDYHPRSRFLELLFHRIRAEGLDRSSSQVAIRT